ncbi:MAG TPA: molybdate ABC transporter substrate-binding protein [Pseudolabrys sp.]|nr:molybdate ABC transporter substrate-binding protein [Pseudolabrys sp.]
MPQIRAHEVLLLLCGALVMSAPAHSETVSLYAAGSLRGALTDVAKAFEIKTGNKVEAKFGPSGALKDEIAGGAKAQVFASANMEHPQALHDEGKSGPVVRFVRNKMCALAHPLLKVDGANLLARMLDPAVKLGISTPKADPSGDYAIEIFRKAGAIKPGAQAALEKKAQQLTGSPTSAAAPAGRLVYGWLVAEGKADIFLTYCTNARAALNQNPDQQMIQLPDNLSVAADYGLTVIEGATPAAQAFANFIVSPEGEAILASYGFAPGN